MPFAGAGVARTDVARTCGAGKAWGVERLALDFPGGPYVVEGLAPRAAALAKGRYGALCVPCGDACFASPARVRFLRPGARDLMPMPEPPGNVYELTIECASLDDRRLRPLSRNTDRSVDSHDRGLLEQTAPFREQGFHLLHLGDAELVKCEGSLIDILNTLDVPAGPLIVPQERDANAARLLVERNGSA